MTPIRAGRFPASLWETQHLRQDAAASRGRPSPQTAAPRTGANLINGAAALLAFASLAMAQEDRVSIHHDAGPNDAWYARAEIRNLFGRYDLTRIYATAHGPVSISYATTTPSAANDPASADRSCVTELPDGVAASPMCIDILERESGSIYLFVYIGG